MALSGLSVVVAQDAAEALPTMHLTGPVPDLAARVAEAIGSPTTMAIRSCQGLRTKFMADLVRLW
jgi:hypothetical protein